LRAVAIFCVGTPGAPQLAVSAGMFPFGSVGSAPLLRRARRAPAHLNPKMKINQLNPILPGFAALDLGARSIHAAAAGAPVAVFGTSEAAEGNR